MSVGSIGGGSSVNAAFLQQMREQMFAKADADQSGGVSLDEFKALGQKHSQGVQAGQNMPSAEEIFASMDADGDGSLSMDEMKPPEGGPRGAGGHQGPPPGGPQMSNDLMSALTSLQSSDDSDSDSSDSTLNDLFASIDTNGDGQISGDEFASLFSKDSSSSASQSIYQQLSSLIQKLGADQTSSSTVSATA
jgi:Ca2+-binding EF-hand superfamily protein